MRRVKTFKSKYKLMLRQRMEAMENEDVSYNDFDIIPLYVMRRHLTDANSINKLYETRFKK